MVSYLTAGAAALVAATSFAAVTAADPAKNKLPSNFNYETDGKSHIRKGNRVTNPDGSWREEIRDKNNCITVKEMKAGVYRETRECPKD